MHNKIEHVIEIGDIIVTKGGESIEVTELIYKDGKIVGKSVGNTFTKIEDIEIINGKGI